MNRTPPSDQTNKSMVETSDVWSIYHNSLILIERENVESEWKPVSCLQGMVLLQKSTH